jgi:hypothetical protein
VVTARAQNSAQTVRLRYACRRTVNVGVIAGNDSALFVEDPAPQKLPEFTTNRNAISVKVSMLILAC